MSTPKPKSGKAPAGRPRRAAARAARNRVVTFPAAKVTNRVVHSTFTGPSTVKGCEVIDFALLSDVFAQTPVVMNPGVEATFPLLSRTAIRFSEYRFKKLAFVYSPTSGTQRDGVVILSWEANAGRTAIPQSFLELEQREHNVHGPVYLEQVLHLPPSPWKEVTVPSAVAPTQPNNLYLHGNANFAVFGGSADVSVVGQIFVEYEVEFRASSIFAGEATSAQRWSSSTAVGSNLLQGMVADSEQGGTYMVPRVAVGGSQFSRLVPIGVFEGNILVEVSGTGFDATTDIIAESVNGDNTNIAADGVTGTGSTTFCRKLFNACGFPVWWIDELGKVGVDVDGYLFYFAGSVASIVSVRITAYFAETGLSWPALPAPAAEVLRKTAARGHGPGTILAVREAQAHVRMKVMRRQRRKKIADVVNEYTREIMAHPQWMVCQPLRRKLWTEDRLPPVIRDELLHFISQLPGYPVAPPNLDTVECETATGLVNLGTVTPMPP